MKRAVEPAVVLLGAFALACVMTYPLIAEVGSSGRLRINDGRWSIWVVAWVAHALTSAPGSVLDANIFYPHQRTLLLSEPNFGAGVIAAPAWAATGNPLFAHNVALLASFVLSAFATFYLAKRLTGHRRGAAVAAVIFAFCPYVFAHTGHIQLVMTAGLPATLLALHGFVDRPSVFRGASIGLIIAAQAFSCGYYGVVAALMALGGVLFFAAGGAWRNPRYWAGAAAGALVCFAMVLPLFLRYLELQRTTGFTRSLAGSAEYSAAWQSYFVSAAWAHRWLVPWLAGYRDVLFPGAFACVLGIAGAYVMARSVERRTLAAFYVALAIVGCWLSFGPRGGLYTLLYETVPVFTFLRAPSRIGVTVTLALAVLSAFGVQALARCQSRTRAAMTMILPLAVAAELVMAPLRLERMPPVPAAYRMLRTLPRGPVAEFPFYATTRDVQFNALYMLWSTYHWQPLVNGYSDIFPPEFAPVSGALATFPERRAFDMLKGVGARYLVVNYPRYGDELQRAIAAELEGRSLYIRPLARQYDVALYEIVGWPAERTTISRGPE